MTRPRLIHRTERVTPKALWFDDIALIDLGEKALPHSIITGMVMASLPLHPK